MENPIRRSLESAFRSVRIIIKERSHAAAAQSSIVPRTSHVVLQPFHISNRLLEKAGIAGLGRNSMTNGIERASAAPRGGAGGGGTDWTTAAASACWRGRSVDLVDVLQLSSFLGTHCLSCEKAVSLYPHLVRSAVSLAETY